MPKFAFTNDRIKVVSPTQPLSLGEDNELTLRVSGGEPVKIWAGQAENGRDANRERPFSRRPDGTLSIHFVPMALGEMKLLIVAQFSDDSFDQSIAIVKVGRLNKPPAWIAIAQGGSPYSDTDYLHVGMDDRYVVQDGGRYQVIYQAYYAGVEEPITLDPAWIKFRIIQPESHVMDLDSRGAIKPLRKGDALLEASFAGAVRRTCVLVRRTDEGFDRGTCKQLRLALLKNVPQALTTTWPSDPDGLHNEMFHAGSEFYTNRLNVIPPGAPVEFGQPITVAVKIASGKLKVLGFQQRRSDMDDPNLQSNKMAGVPGALVMGELKPGESSTFKSIEIVPLTVGDETVEVFARFEDGGFAHRYFRMHVLPSTKGLQRIDVVSRLTKRGRQLQPYLKYEHLGAQVEFPTLSGFAISVEQPRDAPVVRIDPDGWVHEIRPGSVWVTISLGALSGKTLLRVTPPLNQVLTKFAP